MSKVLVPAIALPIAAWLRPGDETPWATNLAVSAGLGAALGGASGLFFPELMCEAFSTSTRLESIRKGVIGGAFGAPAVTLALMGAATWFLKDLVPYGGGTLLPHGSGAGHGTGIPGVTGGGPTSTSGDGKIVVGN